MKIILDRLIKHQKLSRQEAKELLTGIGKGMYNQSQITAFLTVFLMRLITVEELFGFREALLDLCIQTDLSEYKTIDLCGTGGDGKNTFNISTLASFVVAGAGEKVAKHGNYGVSSASGSSNMLEHFGYKFSNNRDKLARELDESGICFLHAPLFHPAMKYVGPIRKELQLKTFFNILGPLVNPSFPQYQVAGVYNLEVARLYQYIFQQTDKQYKIVYSLDGYDEISLTSQVKIISNKGEDLLSPEELGFRSLKQEDLFGGLSVKEAAAIFISILEGRGNSAQKNVVIANAALGLQSLYPHDSWEVSVHKAGESLGSGKALQAFKKLMNLNLS
ncbi:MAG: anthranilate phosphoribosyltransferase [Bacteroidales bacterium]|nr:anthranilate phosphoribosyltransferase [Bacteroidales bacterium]MCF8389483.1 anthranilate phosphoribosyltransferase [Bacteroidales bacterium]